MRAHTCTIKWKRDCQFGPSDVTLTCQRARSLFCTCTFLQRRLLFIHTIFSTPHKHRPAAADIWENIAGRAPAKIGRQQVERRNDQDAAAARRKIMFIGTSWFQNYNIVAVCDLGARSLARWITFSFALPQGRVSRFDTSRSRYSNCWCFKIIWCLLSGWNAYARDTFSQFLGCY